MYPKTVVQNDMLSSLTLYSLQYFFLRALVQRVMEPSRIYSIALVTSAIIFLGHKIEDRFTDKPGKSCAPEHPENWKCKFPGQIVSHKPWDWKTGLCVTFIYVLIGVIVTLGVSKLTFAVEASKTLWTPATVGFVLFSLFWIAWGPGRRTTRRRRTTG